MAIVAPCGGKPFKSDVSSLKKYLEQEDPGYVDANNCRFEDFDQQFKDTQKIHNQEKGHQAIHFVQSWDEEESKMKSAKEFNKIGMDLAKSYFGENHEFIVVTHTETGKTHNHLVINTINAETGKRIPNKLHHLHKLRTKSDELCHENGLKVVQKIDKAREARMPEKVKQIMARQGFSYIMDVREKARQAMSISTSFDEYSNNMGLLGVQVHVQNKNIVYYHPRLEKGKRGAKLGRMYDKDGLMDKFKSNDRKFLLDANTRSIMLEKFEKLKATNGNSVGKLKGNLLNKDLDSWIANKDYSKFTYVKRRDLGKKQVQVSDLESGPFPTSAIEKAKTSSIEDYCRSNKIALGRKDGKTVLKGRDYVEIIGSEWLNTKSQLPGSVIDFVRIHRNVSLVKAVSILNDDKRLMMFERHFEHKKLGYNSFYIPKQNTKTGQDAVTAVGSFLKGIGAKSSSGKKLSNHKQVQVHKNGSIRFYPESDTNGYVDFSQDSEGRWTHKSEGDLSNPFFVNRSKTSNKVLLFADIRAFVQDRGDEAFVHARTKHSVVTLMQPESTAIDTFLGQNRKVNTVFLIGSGKGGLTKKEKGLFDDLNQRLGKQGIKVEQVSMERAFQRPGPERDFLGL
jgi:hypothetical protein